MAGLWQSLPMSKTTTTTAGATIATFTTQGQEGAIRMTAGSYFVTYGTEEQECSSMGLAVRRMLVIIGDDKASVRDSRGQRMSAKDFAAMRAASVAMFGPLS